MKCPKCGIEMGIKSTRHRVENDNTPDKETKLFIEQDLVCRNKECTNYGSVVETIRNPVKLANA